MKPDMRIIVLNGDLGPSLILFFSAVGVICRVITLLSKSNCMNNMIT